MPGKTLRLRELAELFDGEWVLLGDPIKHKVTGQVLGGIVLAHASDRDVVYEAAIRLKPKHFAFRSFKQMPEGHVLVL